MIHKLRIILDSKEDVFRDLEIHENQTLIDLHEGIKSAFELEGNEMASFYLSNDDWYQGSEIPLENLSDEADDVEVMEDVKIKQVISEKGNKMIYVYDFFNLWTFFVEVIETDVISMNSEFPALVFSYGVRPELAPENDFKEILDFDIDFDLDNDDDFEEDFFDESDMW
ncbi:MAG: hypothetical protein Q4G27_03575 [Flavobacteriaceae bacterium]|nr:hypothetical protein [Flavobacteriaceae bacterium]